MSHLAGIVALFVVLIVLELLAPVAFVPVVAVVLIGAPGINWWAFLRLRAKQIELDGEPILSLQERVRTAGFLAIASTCFGLIGLFVVGRVFGVPPMPREGFLVLLAAPPMLLTGPAFEWLLTVGQMDR